MRQFLLDLKLAVKLPAIVVGAAFLVALAVGIASFTTAQYQAYELIEGRMHALLKAKNAELSSYFRSVEQDLRILRNKG